MSDCTIYTDLDEDQGKDLDIHTLTNSLIFQQEFTLSLQTEVQARGPWSS